MSTHPTTPERSRGSSASTGGVRVDVSPRYLGQKQTDEGPAHVFAYRIRIANEGTRTVQLIARRWRIIDADGEVREVEGEGVVGKQPVIPPGEAAEYESFCPLQTSWGTMEGSYLMAVRQAVAAGSTSDDAEAIEDAETFEAKVARFYLVANVDEPQGDSRRKK